MMKLIFLILIIVVIYYLFFKKKNLKNKTSNNDNSIENKDLILCDNCKTFTPEEEIIKINNKNICKECYDNFK